MSFKINSKTIRVGSELELETSNVMCFESNEEFADFCVAPFAVVKRSENGTLYYEGEYSEVYKKCVEEGKTFIIKDENSQVFKRKCVTKRVPVLNDDGVPTRRDASIQLEVQGLQPYFGEE